MNFPNVVAARVKTNASRLIDASAVANARADLRGTGNLIENCRCLMTRVAYRSLSVCEHPRTP